MIPSKSDDLFWVRVDLCVAQPFGIDKNSVTKMTIEAWYMDDSTEDQRLEHRQSPNRPVSFKQLEELGILHWSFPAVDDLSTSDELKAIRDERGYDYDDQITCTPQCLPDYDKKLKMFFQEHIHEDEEIRICLDGSGYFDVRDLDDKWIRIYIEKGDMIVLPEGIYHRFTMDSNNFMKAMRLFKGVPVWTPYNRPQDKHDSRLKYLEQFGKKKSASAPGSPTKKSAPSSPAKKPSAPSSPAKKQAAPASPTKSPEGAGQKRKLEEQARSRSASPSKKQKVAE
jgi:1,2-dihydroxy-3-keto-5-methylthiopentene dioxygenase